MPARVGMLVAALIAVALALFALDSPPKRVHFKPGTSSIVLKNSVVRGERDRYLVGAGAGQTMAVRITSTERNAVFSVARPDGKFLPGATDETDTMNWRGRLPSTGDYLIEVGGTRGNATYALTVTIR
jgi:hypothetical protein